MTMFHYWKTLIATHLPQNTQKGQDLGEYALLFALIALAVVAAVTLLGTDLSDFFGRISAQVESWGVSGG
jgi:Flp pilus assembly pilin Flp